MDNDSDRYVILSDPNKKLTPEQREQLIEMAKKMFRDLFGDEK